MDYKIISLTGAKNLRKTVLPAVSASQFDGVNSRAEVEVTAAVAKMMLVNFMLLYLIIVVYCSRIGSCNL